MNKVIELIKGHKSIRKFTNQQVSQAFITEIVKSAQSASTSSFLQAYSIVGVKSQETKNQLAFLSGEQPYVSQAPFFLVFCADLYRLETACKENGYEMPRTNTELFLIATVDAALAGQNAMLCAESLGLGGVFIGGIRNNPDKVAGLLKLPKGVYPVFGMCVGYPDQSPELKQRLPVELIYHEEYYDINKDISLMETYDQTIKDYYITRTRGKINTTWSESVSKRISTELRPHMKRFLEAQGFMLE